LLSAAALAGGGVVLGTLLTQASPIELMGALAALLAAAAAFYRPSVSLAVLAFTYPFDLHTAVGPVKVTTSAALMVIIALALVVRGILYDRPAWRSTALDVPVLLFAGATLLSIGGSGGHWEFQGVGLLKAAGGFAIFFIATQTLRTKEEVWLVVGAVLASGLIQGASTIVSILNGSFALSSGARARGTFLDPNLFAGYLVLLIPLGLAVAATLRKWWATAAFMMATLAVEVALFATLSRSGLLGLIGATALLLLLWPECRRYVLFMSASAAVLVLAFGLWAPLGGRLGPGADSPLHELASRWAIWTVALQIILHHPLGVGVGNFGYSFSSYAGVEVSHAHNLFLNIAAERGFLGLVAFVIMLAALFRSLRSGLRHVRGGFDQALVVGVTAAFGGFLLHSLLDATYYDYKVLLLFWLLVGVTAVLPRLLLPIAQEKPADLAVV
jgi:O-antigen ligase